MPATLFKEPLIKEAPSLPDRLTKDFISDDILPDDVLYPSEDGKPMAESDFQRIPLTYAIASLEWHFRQQDQVYVTGDLLVYYEEGTGKSVSPDVFVAFDVPKHPRRTYHIWEEGKGPDVVLEILSPSTWKKDVERNLALYPDLGVKEYFIYDPLDKFIQPALQGYWLDDEGQYQPMQVDRLLNGELKLDSHLLGLSLHVDQTGEFRLFNPQTGEYLSTYQEEAQARQQAEAERQEEAQARQQAEAERRAAEVAQQELEQKLREAEEKLRQAGLL